MKNISRYVLLLTCLISACGKKPSVASASNTQNANLYTVTIGPWGGAGVSLKILPRGFFVQFDCAYFESETDFVTDAEGNFDMKVKLVSETSGADAQIARFTGKLTRDRISLRLISDNEASVQNFKLRLGEAPQITPCINKEFPLSTSPR